MAFTETITADGQSASFIAEGPFSVHLSGVFGGGTARLQIRKPGGADYEDVVSADKTAADDFEVLYNGTNTFRFDVSGSTSPSLYILVVGKRVEEVS